MAEISDKPQTAEKQTVKCDNHPDRDAETYTGGGAFEIHLCDDCKLPWIKD